MDDVWQGRERLRARTSRLVGEEVLVAVPVALSGTSLVLPLARVLAVVLVTFSTGRHHFPWALLMLGYVILWAYAKVMARRQTWPVRIGRGGVLAVTRADVVVASVSWWTGLPNRVRASWPRTSVEIELAPRSRLYARRVTLRQESGTVTLLESLVNRAWVDLALRDLQAIAVNGVPLPAILMPAGWYADPSTATDLRYWDGWRWTDRTIDPWTPTA